MPKLVLLRGRLAGTLGLSATCFFSMKTIRQSQLARAGSRRSRVDFKGEAFLIVPG
jgi:hypothetical protein